VLAAFIAEERGASAKEVAAFTWDFSGSDDRRYVDALAESFGIAPLKMAPSQAVPFAPAALLPRGLPYGLVSGPMDAAANAIAAAAGVDALLTGAGGDEILTGPLQSMALAFPRHPWRTLQHAARLQLPWYTSPSSRISDFIFRPLLRPLLPARLRVRAWLRREEAWVSWAGPEARLHRASVATLQATRRTLPRTPAERLARLTDLTAWDRFGDLRTQLEAQGGAVRIDPLLDAEFVQLLVSLPPMLLQDGALHRGLWRRVLRGRVPSMVAERRTKNSFEVAFGEAHPFDAPWFQAFTDVPRALVARGVVDPDAWRPYRDAVRHAPSVAARGAALGFIYDACLVEHFLQVNAKGGRERIGPAK
jgi:asparagine synthetase B (glutamine-hydrolysing)